MWQSSKRVSAQAFEVTISGYNTFNTNALRLWSALPICIDDEQNFDCFEAVKSLESQHEITGTKQYQQRCTTEQLE